MADPSRPLPAATVVLLRDQPDGLQVLLVRRHGASGFMAGATVFPGGKIEPADHDAPAAGLDAGECAQRLGGGDPGAARAAFVAAIRELHEEAGVLLARDSRGAPPDPGQLRDVAAGLAAIRVGRRLPAAGHHRVLAAAGLVPALDALVPLARWLTPRAEPLRFDAWFFAAALPPRQIAVCDGHESTEAFWEVPAQALAEHARGGRVLLPPPTWHTVARLDAGPQSVAETLSALAREPLGPCIEPHVIADTGEGPAIVLPEDPLHPGGARWLEEATRTTGRPHLARVHRFLLRGGRFVPVVGSMDPTA